MNKGTLATVAALVIAALAAFGVIDKETAQKLLSGSTPPPQTEVQVNKPPQAAAKTAGNHGDTTSDDRRWHGWSNHNPQINLSHIFQGEINRNGKPTGFHSRPDGRDPKHARLDRIKSRPNSAGVYTAEISVFDTDENRWKQKFSSFFPDRMNHQAVVNSILHAWNKRERGQSKPWRGPSGHGFVIEGYVSSRGGINTAYPIYQNR